MSGNTDLIDAVERAADTIKCLADLLDAIGSVSTLEQVKALAMLGAEHAGSRTDWLKDVLDSEEMQRESVHAQGSLAESLIKLKTLFASIQQHVGRKAEVLLLATEGQEAVRSLESVLELRASA